MSWLRSIIRRMKAPFAWVTVGDTGVHAYQVNEVTGARRIIRTSEHGYQPIDKGWLETGKWTVSSPPRAQ